jgi:predicted transposase/invertase (TIGR01784 family)
MSVCKDRFVDKALRSRYTDVIFQLQLKGSIQTAYIVTHIEHQSRPQADMPVRVLLYESEIIKDHWYNHKQVPLVYSLVYYNGKKVWHYPINLKAMVNAPADLIDRYFLQPFQLVQLNQIPDEVLRERLWAGLLGLAMKHIYDQDILPVLEMFIDMLQQVEQQGRQDFSSSILYYIIKKGEVSDKGALKSLIDSHLSQETRSEVMTIAEQWREEGHQAGLKKGLTVAEQWRQEGHQEGHQEGIAIGIEQSKLTIACAMLEQNFNLELIAKITGLSIAQMLSLQKTEEIS